MILGGLVTTQGEPTTHMTIESLRPLVDHLLVMVDDRSDYKPPEPINSHRFRWMNSFAKMINEGMGLLSSCDFCIHLDSDETLDCGERLRQVIAQHEAGVDVVGLPRRHFYSLDGKTEHHWVYPDYQYRIRRPNIKMVGRAHPHPEEGARLAYTSLVTINHFNLAVRSQADWDYINAYYPWLESLGPES